jgi:hypothetical protein
MENTMDHTDPARVSGLKIGDRIWRHDVNRRARGLGGVASWFSKMVPGSVVGETSRSFEVHNPGFMGMHEERATVKIPKSPTDSRPIPSGFAASDLELVDLSILSVAYKIGDAVSNCGDAAVLRDVAKALGLSVAELHRENGVPDELAALDPSVEGVE